MWLRQSTAVTIHLGPSIATNGYSYVSGLTAANVTGLRLIKHGSGTAVTATGRTFTHVFKGHYSLALTATGTDTLGLLRVLVTATGAVKSLAFWRDFRVMPTTVFDSLTSGTTRLNVGTLSSGLAVWSVAARTLTSAGTTWTAGTRTLTSGGAVSDSVWVETARTLTSAGVTWSAGTRTLTSAAVAWTAGTRTLTSGGAVSDSVWVETARTLTSAAVTWTAGVRTLTSAAVVWTAGARGLTSKVGFALTSGQHDSIGTRAWANTTRTLTSGLVVWQTTVSELGALPAASPQAKQALGLVYVTARNKRVTSATGDTLYNSATAAILKASLSTAGGVFTRNKYVTAT